MTDKQTFQHVPSWLARRFALIAALEDNPLFLRETGKRYASRRQQGLRRFIPAQLTAIWPFVSAVLLLIAIVVLMMFIGCLAFLLIPLYRRMLGGGRLADLTKLSAFLEQRWADGRLPELWLTSLSGTDVLWGYGARFVLEQLRLTCFLTLAALLAAVTFPQWPLFRGEDLWPFVLPAALTVLVLGMQFFLAAIISNFTMLKRQIANVGQSRGGKLGHSLRNTIAGLLVGAGFLVPTVIAGALLVWAYGDLLAIDHSVPEEWAFPLGICAFLVGFGGMSVPILLAMARGNVRSFLRTADEDYAAAIRRLSEQQEKKPSSQIFGEK
ncbi:hypothetical protein ACFL34_05255 [Candidatus Sumerlaeota bacterium]